MSRRMWGITWLYFRGNGGESVVAEFKGGGGTMENSLQLKGNHQNTTEP